MNKSLKYLLTAFGVLLLLYLVNRGQQNKYVVSSETIFNIESNEVDKFLLKDSSGDTIVLFKTDSLWSILGHDTLIVKNREIDQFFEKVIGGTYDMMMSKNSEKWTTFGVDSSSGKILNIFINDELIESVIFSNKGQDYSHNFYRNIGNDAVFRTSENIFYMLNTRPTYWGSKPKEISANNNDSTLSKD